MCTEERKKRLSADGRVTSYWPAIVYRIRDIFDGLYYAVDHTGKARGSHSLYCSMAPDCIRSIVLSARPPVHRPTIGRSSSEVQY